MRLDLFAGKSWWSFPFITGDPRPENETVDPAMFRGLMKDIPEPVAVIAAGNFGARYGLTATAVTPVSDSPPTMLVCVNRQSSAHDTILNSKHFSINFLSTAQMQVAADFSGASGRRGEARFAQAPWTLGISGAPVLPGTVCTFECRLVESRPVATHTVFLGEIVAATRTEDATPLLYVRGAYRTLPVSANDDFGEPDPEFVQQKGADQ